MAISMLIAPESNKMDQIYIYISVYTCIQYILYYIYQHRRSYNRKKVYNETKTVEKETIKKNRTESYRYIITQQ